ncbi:MAG: hypothetical protein LBP87_02900, partial [Planctomycetaceae bacterium]|nr:hypothetical protein [Planctomycetaceae bacterium]
LSHEDYFFLDRKIRHWLDKHCQYEGNFGKFHYENPKYFEVFLYSPQSPVQSPDSVTTENSEQ